MKLVFLLPLLISGALAASPDGNRLTYLDDSSPFWPKADSARLITPQWVGEPGVDAVIILAIDDMRDTAKYESFLRPILDRLKRIDGRAPVSIMTNSVDPADPQLQAWLQEGLSLEVHTLAHPCPCLGKMSLEDAAQTFLGGIDLLASVPGNRPVAFRMPCCDSMNSASPRFFAEIFPRRTEKGNALSLDSSVFTLPPGERFAKYFPPAFRPPMKKPLGDYAGFIEDYPFPYQIGESCWEFPCIVPSDWEAFNVLRAKSAEMLEDWKAALDRIVTQQGVFTAVFHPHGWSGAEQWVAFIDYAERTYGKRIKFLNFREAEERLARAVPKGQRLVDLDHDGRMEGVVPKGRFGVIRDGAVSMIAAAEAWTWRNQGWEADSGLAPGREVTLLRDFDRDGTCELLSGREVFRWEEGWKPAGFSLPPDFSVTDAQGRDNGLRFVDLNRDGFEDVIQSNDAGYAVYLWAGTVKDNLGWKRGWPHLGAEGPADPKARVLPFVSEGRNAGAWVHREAIVWQNEALATPASESVRRTFAEIIAFPVPPEKSPEEGLAALRPRPGFTAELVAAEPLLDGPVAFDWDAQGRLWVVEMRDYPLGCPDGGRVKILTDVDGDGRYDEAKTVASGLPFPSGILPWRDGALVASSPDILFVSESGEKRVLFTGFKPGNQQHRLNGFEWGLDGWVYGANGDSGGVINGVNISGRDFRFRPDTGEFEAESGQTQYGRRRDDWGNWFGNNNPVWLWHYTISDAHLRRNPKLAVKTTKRVLANYEDSTRVFAISELPVRFNQPQSAGHVTSGCSPAPYRDDLFGPEFASSVFSCEPVHNVVHREVLTPDGATFTSRRAADELDREFLASTDPWFRPVFAKTGPDGALYVADFHRFVLEHPEWIAPETQARLDLRLGEGKGRLYRVFPQGTKLRPIPNLEAADPAALDSPNGWQRDTVQRLLVEAKRTNAAPGIRKLAIGASNPKVRVQALATLAALGAIDAETRDHALRAADSRVRVQALRVADDLASILPLVDDAEFLVRHELALRLGDFREAKAAAALQTLANREGDHPQMRLAILSSLVPEDPLFVKLNDASKIAIPAIVLPKPSTADRAKVLATYAPAAGLKGDPARGGELFRANCIVCHRFHGEGVEAGPDLAMVADKPIDWLLTAILDPNAAIEERFKTWRITLKSGAELSGILAAETANNIVLRLPGGVDLPVLRSDIASQTASGKSLMPEGLETVLSPQGAADLIAYLRTQRPAS
jgi:putative membrane-bound dehydrogenase-like protein